jgi:hypothetical protein
MSRHEMLGSVLDLGSRIGMPFLIIRSTSLGWAAFVTGSSATSLQAPSHFSQDLRRLFCLSFRRQTVTSRGKLTVLIGRSHLERPFTERPFVFSIRPSG